MFAVIYLPDFTLQAALRHEPELWARPVALVDPAMPTPRVCALTAAARGSGVTDGLTPTQALARCRDVLIRHRSPAREVAVTAAMLQCAYGFSPHLESTAPGLGTLNLRGLASLPWDDSEKLLGWAERLRIALQALQLQARIGMGPTPQIARHAARWMGSRAGAARDIQIVLEPESFVGSLPVEALEPSTDVAPILQKWGIRTVGELLALGQEALSERLGLEALALCAAASVTAVRPLRLVRPADEFEESFEFEPGVETLEPLLFMLRRFVDQLGPRLALAGLVAALLTLRLRLESGQVIERQLRLPQPTRQPDILFRMLHTHLETLRADESIAAVSLKADPTEPERKQFTLFEAALRDPQRFQETLANLSALLGADRVGTPVRENSHRPDAFKMVPPDFDRAPDTGWPRTAEIGRGPSWRRLRPTVAAQVQCERPNGSSDSPLSEPGSDGVLFFPDFIERPPGKVSDAMKRLPPGLAGAPGSVVSSRPLPDPRDRAGGKESALSSAAPAVSRPVSVRCQMVKGKLKVAIGPWRASGRWWEPGAWQREEWDVEMADGSVYRLNHDAEGWHVEGMLD